MGSRAGQRVPYPGGAEARRVRGNDEGGSREDLEGWSGKVGERKGRNLPHAGRERGEQKQETECLAYPHSWGCRTTVLVLCDHSLKGPGQPLWPRIVGECKSPHATLPSYICPSRNDTLRRFSPLNVQVRPLAFATFPHPPCRFPSHLTQPATVHESAL